MDRYIAQRCWKSCDLFFTSHCWSCGLLELPTVVGKEAANLSSHHRSYVNFLSLMKHTGNNNTIGILVLCTIFGFAFQISFLPRKELALAFLLLVAAARSLLSPQGIHFYFLLFHGISFLIVGLDLIIEQGTFRPGSEFDQLHTEDSVPKSHDGKTTVTAYEDSKSRL